MTMIQFLLGVDAPVSLLLLQQIFITVLVNTLIALPVYALVRRIISRRCPTTRAAGAGAPTPPAASARSRAPPSASVRSTDRCGSGDRMIDCPRIAGRR